MTPRDPRPASSRGETTNAVSPPSGAACHRARTPQQGPVAAESCAVCCRPSPGCRAPHPAFWLCASPPGPAPRLDEPHSARQSSCRRPCRGLHSRREAVPPPVFQTIGPGARRPAGMGSNPCFATGGSETPRSPRPSDGGRPRIRFNGWFPEGRPTEQAAEHPARRGSLASGRRRCKSVTTARTTTLCAPRAPAASRLRTPARTRSPDPAAPRKQVCPVLLCRWVLRGVGAAEQRPRVRRAGGCERLTRPPAPAQTGQNPRTGNRVLSGSVCAACPRPAACWGRPLPGQSLAWKPRRSEVRKGPI